jgi:hypothetical protein
MQRLNSNEANVSNLSHEYNWHRDALIQFGTHDWKDVIRKAFAIKNGKKK